MTTITINDQNIANLEAAGFRRWTRGRYDRLYINPKDLGADVEYYGTGNIAHMEWAEMMAYDTDEYVEYPYGYGSLSNAEARRILGGKYYIDINTGRLHVDTSAKTRDAIRVLIEHVIEQAID